MKKLLVFALFFSTTFAHASRMDTLILMADNSILQTLQNQSGEIVTFEVLQRDFVKAEACRDLALRTDIIILQSPHKREWTCVSQFVKTAKFFEVSETVCN